MPRPFRAINVKTRDFLLAELHRLRRQERTPNEQMIERFLQCEEAQRASRIMASVIEVRRFREQDVLPTPTPLLPWLQ